MFNPVVFREYDVRGVYEKDFDLDFAKKLGKAYASFHKKVKNIESPVIVIGNDARLSSPAIVNALAEGMSESGANVKTIGLVTTAMTYFTTFYYPEVSGAIMVTGSHNPPDYNGFKISVGSNTISGSDIQELKKIIESEDYITGTGSIETKDIFSDYLSRYTEEFGKLKEIPVVVDCGNGAAGCVLRKLYEGVGLKPVVLFEEPDGTFPNHHPDPTIEENMEELKKRVLESKAKIGIGFDGDADRIGIVDENGKFLLGDEILCLMTRSILEEHPGKEVVADVKCSDRFFKDVEDRGGKPVMWKTGHSLIKNKIKELKIPFGGEYSGHVFYNDRNYGYDDALYAGLRVIEDIAKTGKGVRELLEGWPEAYNTPEIRIDTTEEKKISIVEAVKQHFSAESEEYSVNQIDGIRISFKDGWALARASNTQPVLSLRYEASTEEGLKQIRERIEGIINPLL